MSSKVFARIALSSALVFGLAPSMGLAQTSSFEPANLGESNIVNTAVAAGTFNTLNAALESTGLDVVLADPGRNFTVFAPTDEAFAALGQDTINNLLNDRERLTDILLYHVVADTVVDSSAARFLAGQSASAANGDSLNITAEDGGLFINMSRVTTADVGALNGIIHIIDRVLLPPVDMPLDASTLPNIVETAVAAGSFNTLVAALQATGLDATLTYEGAYTVFAPTDAAFSLLGESTIDALLNDVDALSDILLYHVISGQVINSTDAIALVGQSVRAANNDFVALRLNDGNLLVNSSTVITTDIMTSNGVIHVIDAVLTPPMDEVVADGSLPNIVQTLAADFENFRTLSFALEQTGLSETLAGEGPFTLFAPTVKAMGLLGDEELSRLLLDNLNGGINELRDILLYHVIAENRIDTSLGYELSGQALETANGSSIVLNSDGEFTVNGVTVFMTNIETSNGIIHVIDTVLQPPTGGTNSGNDGSMQPPTNSTDGTALPNIVETLAADFDRFRTLSFALEQSGLDTTLAGEGPFTFFAPTARAFNSLESLLFDEARLRDTLLYHVVSGQTIDTSTAFGLSGQPLLMANGDSVVLNSDGKFTVNGVTVFMTNIETSNGIIHVIDTVLLPPSFGEVGGSDTGHVPSEGTDMPVSEDDQAPDNSQDADGSALGSIMDIVVADADAFSTLRYALEETGLDATLAGAGSYTVFAPTNKAFAALGEETLDALLLNINGGLNRLSDILRYHVIAGQAIDTSTAFGLSGQELVTVNGDTIVLNSEGRFTVNGITVFSTNIQASNGIIHVIDSVLLP